MHSFEFEQVSSNKKQRKRKEREKNLSSCEIVELVCMGGRELMWPEFGVW